MHDKHRGSRPTLKRLTPTPLSQTGRKSVRPLGRDGRKPRDRASMETTACRNCDGSTNMLERLNEEIRLRTYVVRIFPNAESCLRLVRALAVETHENWMEANRYIHMDDLREHKKLAMRQAA